MNIKGWFKRRLEELQIADPNSPKGLRLRAKRLIEKGTSLDNPYVTMLLKMALLKEGKRSKHGDFPSPNVWDAMSCEEKEEWVIAQLGIKKGKL